MKTKGLLISFALGLALASLWLLGISGTGLSASLANADQFPPVAPAAPNRIIVELRSELAQLSTPTGHASLDGLLARFEVQAIVPLFDATRGDLALKQDLGLSRVYVLTLPPSSDLQDALAAFSADPAVEYAELDFIGYGTGLPNDASFGLQWNLHNTGQSGGKPDADIDAPEAWDISAGAASTVLAIIDTGADLDHPDLAGKIVAGYDFANTDAIPQDDHGHGTHVAGIAAATTNNGTGVAGVCPECRIMPLKAMSSTNWGYYSWWASAIEYAVDNGADVINMSMGGTSDSSLLHDAVRYAYNADVPIVAAMMNDGDSTIYYPAVFTETIAVGSTDRHDNRSSFSNFGDHIDLVAPGTSILSTMWDDTYATWSGTSMATPHAAGVLGLVNSVRSGYTVEELRTILRTTADDQVGPPGEDTEGWDSYFGSGRLNAARALQSVVAVITVCHGGSCDFDNIQDAVDLAIDSSIIKVAAGTYTDTNNYGGLTQAVYISKSVTIRGGYTTAFADPPDPDANPTTVDAQSGGRVFYIAGAPAQGAGVSPIIEGLRITGGNASGLGGGQGGVDAGGGVYISTATATIRNSRVFNNTASQGGGLYLGSGTTTLSGNTISGNNATNSGGGLYLSFGSATLSGNTVSGNDATNDGGGLLLAYSDTALSGNTIMSNTTSHDGGGLYLWGGDATLSGNTVVSNTASHDGGGVYLRSSDTTFGENNIAGNSATHDGGGLYLRESDTMLAGSTIISNVASHDGGGLYMWTSDATFSGNSIVSNHVGNRGGGLYLGFSDATFGDNTISGNSAANDGGGLCAGHSTANLNNNTVSGNSATDDGGGLLLAYGDATLSGNAITSNTAGGEGGGLYLFRNDATLVNALVADNRATSQGSGLYVEGSSARLLHTTIARNTGGDGSGVYAADTFDASSTVALTNTILVSHTVGLFVTSGNTATLEATLWGSEAWANESEWGGTGTIYTGTVNIWEIPCFVDPDAGDYHICWVSGARDAGVDAGVADDIDGDARPQASGYDVGADEHTQPKAIGNLRATNAFTDTATLTVTLTWSAPSSAVTYTLRYSSSLITDGNWAAATVITDTLPGNTSRYTATVPYSGGIIYFALAYWNNCGEESFVSNNAFWPRSDVYLPLVMRSYTQK